MPAMKFNLRILSHRLFGKNPQLIIGRWNIDYDKNIQERKVYLTNMDHCGCCGNFRQPSNKKITLLRPAKKTN